FGCEFSTVAPHPEGRKRWIKTRFSCPRPEWSVPLLRGWRKYREGDDDCGWAYLGTLRDLQLSYSGNSSPSRHVCPLLVVSPMRAPYSRSQTTGSARHPCQKDGGPPSSSDVTVFTR